MTYREIVIEAEGWTRSVDRQSASYRVRVLASPSGELAPESAVPITYDVKTLRAELARLEQRELDFAGLIDLGRTLAAMVFPSAVRDLLAANIAALGPDYGLRIRLRLPRELAGLPWEYAYVDRSSGERADGFLALDTRIAFVRHEAMAQPIELPQIAGDLVVVFALASPVDLPELELATEIANLEGAFGERSGVRVVRCEDATLDKVTAVLDGAAIFHFAGHGAYERKPGSAPGGNGMLAFTDANVGSEEVAVTLRGRGIRLAVLAACATGRRDSISIWSGVAPALVAAGIPAVVANQDRITDAAALAFNGAFYRALAGGAPLERAVTLGRLAAYNVARDGVEWGVPVLYLRAGDGELFTAVDAEHAAAVDANVRVGRVAAGAIVEGAKIGAILAGTVAARVIVAGPVAGDVRGPTIGAIQGGNVDARVNTGDVDPGGHVAGPTIDTIDFRSKKP